MSVISVNLISLGCSKNLIDAERLMRMLDDVGCEVQFEQPQDSGADIVIINTCGFIGDAKEESINTILKWVQAKKEGLVKEIFVMGCLSERYRVELPVEIDEVDRWYGKTDWIDIAKALSRRNPSCVKYDRVITTPRHHAYLKISEGCNRFCAFCAIPLITGRFKSRPIDEIVDEVKMLVGRGVKEFNIIAQELTSYGLDIYGTRKIAELVDAVAAVDGVRWIRLHYAYPAEFPLELLDAMSRNKNVCRYLDIALQHVSDNVLSNMRRHITGAETRALLDRIREKVPGIHIRTTLMVGFPGEGEKEFDELLDFVKEQKFERMGAFSYCEEEDTAAARDFVDEIPDEVKKNRLDRLMAVQEAIAIEQQEAKIGKCMRIIIDREDDDFYYGRSEFDSPEVDPEVLVTKNRKLDIGEFYDVEITGAYPFELMAKIIE